jgi:hypothetical protein
MDNVTVENMPAIGTALMVAIFVYAWIADTAERKEAFTGKQSPPIVTEHFFNPNQIPQTYRPYA